VAPPTQTATASAGIIGQRPTAVDFTDPSHGWIASGSGAGGNPTIVRTTNGGQTWSPTSVPNLSAQYVAPATRYAFGGLVGINFDAPLRGWFYQAGLGWQTNDAGVHWTKMRLPVRGALVVLTSSGHDVWALLDTCSIGAVSCPQNLARGSLYHATAAANLQWQRIGAFVPAGIGSLYPTANHSVLVAIGAQTYRRSLSQKVLAAPDSDCYPVGVLSGGAMAGICDVGGGGDASVTKVALSSDHGINWQPLVGGPPSSQWEGSLTTNGTDAIFYVTGGQTLWRSSTTSQPGWRAVLQVPARSQDEIYPVYVDGDYGLALVSDGLDVHWFETHDSGMTWEPVKLP
jgi:hypothetical protein